MKNALAGALGGVLGIIWMFAGPVTYILLVVDTWKANTSAGWKILMNLTVDGILAMLWPFTWVLWAISYMSGRASPINTVLGF